MVCQFWPLLCSLRHQFFLILMLYWPYNANSDQRSRLTVHHQAVAFAGGESSFGILILAVDILGVSIGGTRGL